MDKNRVVEVYIADAQEGLPEEVALVYKGKAKFTKLLDGELFYEINPQSLLADHNDKRTALLDPVTSRLKQKDVYFEPIRLKDLVFKVVTLAEF